MKWKGVRERRKKSRPPGEFHFYFIQLRHQIQNVHALPCSGRKYVITLMDMSWGGRRPGEISMFIELH